MSDTLKTEFTFGTHCSRLISTLQCVTQGSRIASASSVRVSVGVDNKNKIDQKETYLGAQVYVHPAYTAAPRFHNDIAIIKLQRPIAFNSGVQPACLNFVDQHRQFLVASGYGTTSPQYQVVESPF